LIPCSAVRGLDFEAPPLEKMEFFSRWLKEKGVSATLRRSKGGDIQAACGQLAGRQKKSRT